MNGKQSGWFFVIIIFGCFGFRSICYRIFSGFLPSHFPYDVLMFVFFCFGAWYWSDLQKEIKRYAAERTAVEKHNRRKQSVILKNHPLFESKEDLSGISSMDELGYFFDRHEDEVADMDWDSSGHDIFKDHKYYR